MFYLLRVIIVVICFMNCFGCAPDSDDLKSWYKGYESGEISKSRAIELMSDALKRGKRTTRSNAAMYLGRIADCQGVEPLLAALKDESCFVRKDAILSLGKIGDPRATEPLIALLEDTGKKKCYNREEVATALGDIKDPRAVEPLIRALKHGKAWWVHEKAAIALGKIADPRAVNSLIELLESHSHATKEAAWALGEIKDQRAIEPLIETLIKSSHDAYKIIFPTKKEAEKKRAYEDIQNEAIEALVKIGNPVVEPLINSIMERGSWGVKKGIAKALKNIGESRAINHLIETLKDDDENVREKAMRALSVLGASAVDPLITIAENKNSDLRLVAVMAISRIRVNKAVQYLNSAFKKHDLEVVAQVYSFFIRRGEQDSLPVLIEVLHRYGDKTMASDFLNSGNDRLKATAANWATKHGYVVTQTWGSSGLEWGSER